ncbi:TonB-dependent siderophore receptor [Marilutibacter maris]|uniref:TonB-dependent siderophore receptor n=1 Tax=Marilutibacter maris TaxID=1605891 RepID=A0A2U9T4S2_9GAMM|nr:TonB-dependent siderophore receptor [Lysobacter maris]AWV07513.1 TonB-dependent siderophore receptor [Lysobacter maris]
MTASASPLNPSIAFSRVGARRLLSLCVAAGLWSPLASAGGSGHSADATDLDTVRVTGQRLDRYGIDQSSTATRLALTPRETPQSVSAVNREQMDDFGLTRINDVLGATTGVTVESVETSRTYYTSRGFDVTNFQRDGLGLPLPYGIQDGDLDTALYERIEVLRGANGLMSSTGNPSATVNFVRKRPTADLRGQAQLTIGSWDRRRIDIDVSGPLAADGGVRGRAVAAWEEGDSHLDRYSLEKQVYYGVVEADLGAATTLAAGASYQRNNPNSPLWGALPLYYSDGSPTDYDVSTSTASDWSFWDQEDTRAFVELDQAIGGWNLRASLNYQNTRSDTELFYVYGTPDRDTGLGLFSYPSDYDGEFSALHADVYATGPIMLGGREHEVVIGGNWADGENEEVSWYSTDIGTPLPPLQDWGGRYPKPAFDAYSDGSRFDYRRDSLYATVRWDLADGFKLITGVNRARARTRGHSYGEATTVDETRTTPFAGAVWDLGEHYSAYASYGEIFNQQAEVDENNRLLGALTGSNREIGLKGEWFDGGLNASLAVFRTRQDNLAESAGFNTDTGQTYYRGIDAESQGFEIDIAGRIGDHWQLAGGFTRLQIDDAGGHAARTYVPRELLRLSATWQVPQVQGLRVGARVNWQGDIHRDTAIVGADGRPARIRQDAYALLGLMARYDFARRWSATLNLDNVSDEKYIPSLYWEQGYYGAPRHASLTIGYRF